MTPQENPLQRELIGAQTYREFIRRWMGYRKGMGKPMGYADISRRAGFASRSFPRDVVLGSKRITLQSLRPMIRGLGLTGGLAQFFQLLVEAEHPECRNRNTSDERILNQIELLRSRILKVKVLSAAKSAQFFETAHFPVIYAALGSIDEGALLREIVSRTQLPRSTIMEALNALRELGAIEQEGSRWKVRVGHLNLTELSDANGFEHFFRNAQIRAASSMGRLFSTQEALYFGTCFSVESSQIPQLRERLRALLLEFAENAEVAKGDRVVTVTCSML